MYKKRVLIIGMFSLKLIGMGHPLDPQRLAPLLKAMSPKEKVSTQEETPTQREKREKAERFNRLAVNCTATSKEAPQPKPTPPKKKR